MTRPSSGQRTTPSYTRPSTAHMLSKSYSLKQSAVLHEPHVQSELQLEVLDEPDLADSLMDRSETHKRRQEPEVDFKE